MRKIVLITLAASVAVAAALIRTHGSGSASGELLTVVGNKGGRVVWIDPKLRAGINRPVARGQRARVTRARLLAIRNNRRFLRIKNTAGSDCYAVARPEQERTGRFGMVCSQAFPSEEQPILDSSIFGADRKGEPIHAILVQGFAADGVAAIGLVDGSGTVRARVPVRGNVYYLDRLPAGRFLTKLVALDEADKILFSLPS